jgi:AcrR family transcriptional regulator
VSTTRERLLVAVREAAFEGPLDDLTPAEVARRAGAHRVTFYRFWPDIRSATIEAFTAEIDRLVTVRDEDIAGVSETAELARIYDVTLQRSLAEVRDHRPVYRALFAWPAFQTHAQKILRERAQLMITAMRAAGREVRGAESGTAAEFVAGASVAIYAAWAADDDLDVPTRARDIIDQMPAWWPRARASADD